MIEKITQTYKLANDLLKLHGLDDWTFGLTNTKHRVGECNHTRKQIGFSIHFLEKTDMVEITDTILHEIAHALVGYKAGHNWEWKRKCLEIGARPERCTDEAETTARYNYIIKCPSCGQEWKRYRLRKSLFGQDSICCGVKLKFFKYVA